MNKRIKKKKAKQALEREQEKVAQELANLTIEDIQRGAKVISKVLQELTKTISVALDGLVVFLKNLEGTFESIEQQGIIQPRPRALQVQRYRTSYMDKKSRTHVQQWRRNCRQSRCRYQQANRKHSPKTKYRRPTKKSRAV